MDDLPEADLYILSRVLHDWPDEKIHILLKKISAVCRPGRFLISYDYRCILMHNHRIIIVSPY